MFVPLVVHVDHDECLAVSETGGGDADVEILGPARDRTSPPTADLLRVACGFPLPTVDKWQLGIGDERENVEALRRQFEG
jgi:hypothetical protein